MSSFNILIHAYDSSGNTKRIIFNDYAFISTTFFPACHTWHKSIYSVARSRFNNETSSVTHLGLAPDLCCCQVTDLRDGQKQAHKSTDTMINGSSKFPWTAYHDLTCNSEEFKGRNYIIMNNIKKWYSV